MVVCHLFHFVVLGSIFKLHKITKFYRDKYQTKTKKKTYIYPLINKTNVRILNILDSWEKYGTHSLRSPLQFNGTSTNRRYRFPHKININLSGILL